LRVKRYMASVELLVDVEVSTDEEEAGNAEAVDKINRLLLATAPPWVVGAWVSYVESEEDDPNRGGRRKR